MPLEVPAIPPGGGGGGAPRVDGGRQCFGMIQITLNQRTQAVELALHKAIAARLAKNPGVKPGRCAHLIDTRRPRGLVFRRRQGAVRLLDVPIRRIYLS